MSFSNLSVSYFMVYWFHKVMKFSLETENRKKICRYIHGLLKNRYKVLLVVRQTSQVRSRGGS